MSSLLLILHLLVGIYGYISDSGDLLTIFVGVFSDLRSMPMDEWLLGYFSAVGLAGLYLMWAGVIPTPRRIWQKLCRKSDSKTQKKDYHG